MTNKIYNLNKKIKMSQLLKLYIKSVTNTPNFKL